MVKSSCRPGTNVEQTPVETPVAREVDVDALVDNSRKISRFGAVHVIQILKNFKMRNAAGSQCFHSTSV